MQMHWYKIKKLRNFHWIRCWKGFTNFKKKVKFWTYIVFPINPLINMFSHRKNYLIWKTLQFRENYIRYSKQFMHVKDTGFKESCENQQLKKIALTFPLEHNLHKYKKQKLKNFFT